MIKSKKNKFISEIKDLIKSLLNFCKYEIKILNNEISIYIKSEDLVKTLLFFKDNPTFNLVTLIDLTKPPKLLPECKRRLGCQGKSPASQEAKVLRKL